MKKIIGILSFLLVAIAANATHNRAGEITYRLISGLKYEITVITYTDPLSTQADRCELEIQIAGTNSTFIDTIQRINDNSTNFCNCNHGNCGEILVPNKLKKNIYRTVYTFPGFDNYTISMSDPNRNEGILNIPNSVDVSFFLQNTFTPNPFIGLNSSPVLVNPPLDNGCINTVYNYNNMAVDPDGDSLVYTLVNCYADYNTEIPLYMLPNFAPSGTQTGNLSIDSYTGNIVWESPTMVGEYNFCVLVEEYRKGIKIGDILRDMQITIFNCNNDPPEIDPLEKLCVIAGDVIDLDVVATDPDSTDLLTITSASNLYSLAGNPAQFDTTTGGTPLTANFSWATQCKDVKKNPYLVDFKAKDSKAQFSLQDFEVLEILVIAPAPTNPSATPNGNSIDLNWTNSICSLASEIKIYRRADSLGFVNDTCETGVPASTGYQLIATVNGSQTNYTDNISLVQGQEFCYMVVACYSDGAESKASVEFCAELKKDVPVITRVSVNSTSESTGSDTITWSMPTEMDLIQYPGPYLYEIYRDNILIGTTNANSVLSSVDTLFVDSLIDTKTMGHTYKIMLNSNNISVGETQSATSIFITVSGTDNIINLSWNESVPWTNNLYVIYKKNKATLLFDSLSSTNLQQYSDTGLTNGIEECYFIKSIGKYAGEGFIDPIINNSQEVCAVPIDDVAPCSPPNIFISADCDENNTDLTWDNPNETCSDDAVYYKIYYAPEIGIPLQLIDSIVNSSTTHFSVSDFVSIAGCYSVTAVDTFFNESLFGDILCVDNCPSYELPNVFTPGGDGVNDFFTPFPFKYIEEIDLKIYNRWGAIVFETTDPKIMWDGKHMSTNKQVSEGVYYYIGIAKEVRLSGLEEVTIKGFIHVINGSSNTSN